MMDHGSFDSTSHAAGKKKKCISDKTLFHATLVACASLVIALLVVLFSQGQGDQGSAVAVLTTSIDREMDPYWRLRPKNLHIVMMGDSVTHYQYLSLAYFLRTGRWFDPMRKKSHLTNVNSFENIFHRQVFGEFFFQTTRFLQPQEICDCIYPKQEEQQDANSNLPDRDTVVINRYFHDPERNNTLRFFHSSDTQKLQGRLSVLNVTEMAGKEQDGLLNGMHQFQVRTIAWTAASWAELLRDYVARLDPRPEYVLLNGSPAAPSDINDLKEALHQIGIVQAFWKTTAYTRATSRASGDDVEQMDQTMCQELGGCLDISWTKRLNEKLFWDEVHNKEPVYRVMNEDLLDMIGYLPHGYAKFDRKLLLGK